MKKILKKLNYQPTIFTEKELLNPEMVLTNFFDNFPIHECRNKLWDLHKGWTIYAGEHADALKIVDMILFYDQLIEFMNASLLNIAKEKIEAELPN